MAFDWKKTVGAIAPTIGTVLGGPLGGLAGAALASVFGVENTPDAIEAAVQNASPEQMIALRNADNDFKVKMAELGFKSVADLEKIAADDRANARSREIATNDIAPRLIAAVFIVGWFAIQWYLLSHVIPAEMREIIMRTLGTLDMGLGLILGYYYGSSAGSAEKSKTIAALQK